ncbi:GATA transcription factor, partial [Trema orientale]
MDFCWNVSISPPSSDLNGSSSGLDDLFSSQNTEEDLSLEWLSVFVEDCLTSSGNCLPAPTTTTTTTAAAANIVHWELPGPVTRRCSHCLSQRTPQWRAGPLGPKTLCNACGVRYKS